MKMRQISSLGIGLGAIAALSSTPAQAEPAQTVQTISQAIPLGNGMGQSSGWYGSLTPSVVFGPSIEGESEAFTFNDSFECNDIGNIDGFLDFASARALCFAPIIDEGDEVQSFDLSLETETGFGISGAIGYRFTPATRAELELGYSRNTVNGMEVGRITRDRANTGTGAAVDSLPGFETDLDGKIETLSLMASGYYDINSNSHFKPYLGGGIGIAKLSASDIEANIPEVNRRIDLDDSSASFIFQVKAGTAYKIGDRGSVSLGYRLQGLPGQKFEADGIDFDAQTVLTHAVEFGGQYRF